MELRNYIELAEKNISTTALALAIGVRPENIAHAKAGRRGLPLVACWKLADLIGLPHDTVSAASALVTEKDEKAREYLRPFAQNLSKAASIFMMCALNVIFWTAGNDAEATPNYDADTLKVSPKAATASPTTSRVGDDLYYVKCWHQVKAAIASACNKFAIFFRREYSPGC